MTNKATVANILPCKVYNEAIKSGADILRNNTIPKGINANIFASNFLPEINVAISCLVVIFSPIILEVISVTLFKLPPVDLQAIKTLAKIINAI